MKVLERSDGLARHLTKWARSIQQRNEQSIMIEAVAKQFEKKKIYRNDLFERYCFVK